MVKSRVWLRSGLLTFRTVTTGEPSHTGATCFTSIHFGFTIAFVFTVRLTALRATQRSVDNLERAMQVIHPVVVVNVSYAAEERLASDARMRERK